MKTYFSKVYIFSFFLIREPSFDLIVKTEELGPKEKTIYKFWIHNLSVETYDSIINGTIFIFLHKIKKYKFIIRQQICSLLFLISVREVHGNR